MDATNEKILKQLQEYAAMYFAAIVEKNTDNGKCQLKPGKYSAKELADSNKAACGSYELPEDSIFDESVEITADSFGCEFPYRRIFAILAQWEAMSKAGKQKAVFEIGEVEEKSAKVLLNEKTELGAFKTKSVKLQRIIGNWWMPRKVKKNQPIELYYELNGVMLVPGKQVWSDSPTDPQTVKWCEQRNDEEISKLLLSFISNDREGTQQKTPYYAEVVNRANIAATPAETPRIVRVEIVRDFDSTYYANLYGGNGGCHNLSKEYTDFRTLKTLCKKEYGVNLPNLSQIEFETHGRKSYAYISTETPRISTETVETTNVSAEAKQGENEAGMPKYTIYNRDGYTWVVFERGIIRQCAKRSGVSCKCAEWDTIAQAYNGVHSSMGFGNYFFFDSEADAIRFAELVAEGDVCGYWKLYMANLKAEIEAKKQRIAEECAEFDEAQAYFAEIDAGRIAQSLTTPPTPPDESTIHPADKTPTERTETAETVNVSAEDGNAENEPIKHISEIMETCRTWDDEKRVYTDEYKYYTWLANHIPEHKATNKNTTELILEEVRERILAAATLAAHGVPKCDMEGAVCAIINRLAKMEDILQFHNRTEPPQSSEAPQTAECTTDTPKPQEMARKEPKQVIRNSRTTQRRTIKRFLIVQSVPRLAKCSTAHHIAGASKMVYSGIIPSGYAPPIRGDCKLSISTRAKPPNRASCEKINILQPP